MLTTGLPEERVSALKNGFVVLCAGAIIAFNAGVSVVAGIFICWVALFAPGIILIYGFMPWWGSFRHFQVYRR